jgi:hypothetical protein
MLPNCNYSSSSKCSSKCSSSSSSKLCCRVVCNVLQVSFRSRAPCFTYHQAINRWLPSQQFSKLRQSYKNCSRRLSLSPLLHPLVRGRILQHRGRLVAQRLGPRLHSSSSSSSSSNNSSNPLLACNLLTACKNVAPMMHMHPPSVSGAQQTYANRPMQSTSATYVPAPSPTAPAYNMPYPGGAQQPPQFANSSMYSPHAPMPGASSYAMAPTAPNASANVQHMMAPGSVGGPAGGMVPAGQMSGVQGPIAPVGKMVGNQQQYFAGQGAQMAFVGQPAGSAAAGAGAMYQYPGGPSHFVAQQPGVAPLAPPGHAYSTSAPYMQNMAPHPGGAAMAVPPPAAAPAAPVAKGKGGKSSNAQRSNAVPITIPPSLLPPVRCHALQMISSSPSEFSSPCNILSPLLMSRAIRGSFYPSQWCNSRNRW